MSGLNQCFLKDKKLTKSDTAALAGYDRSYNCIVGGADEAGRGPLAGPVVCACVVMPLDEDSIIHGVTDSKKLSQGARQRLYNEIILKAIQYKVAVVDNTIIDSINILEATKLGLCQAIDGLTAAADIILVDAISALDTPKTIKGIVKGDATSYNIAAASIIAKVTRDGIMEELDKQYDGYGLASHKGYPTRAHYTALSAKGITPVHRKSFLTKPNRYWKLQ